MQPLKLWLYLEPILSNEDGDLGAKFRKVDQAFKQVARLLEADPRLSALVQSSRLQPMIDSISDQLNSCQSALIQYIDAKRLVFPRLYFLSDDDLLELLGQARAGAEGRETVMQSHLKKLFPGITGVRLGPGGLSITALCSHFDESFHLEHPVDIDCPVEVWLKKLEDEIRASLKNVTIKCLTANGLQVQDPLSLPTQILCLAQNVRFTDQTETAITAKELRKLKEHFEKENAYYAETDEEDEREKFKRQALILQCDYYILVIQNLIENNVASTSDWLWQKQLRFYLVNNDVVAKMGLAEISYSYEYLGVETGQFVRTDITDECFLILTQSLHLGLVGNPFGPAGTGKTESVKALGGLFGRLVLVFNCDEAMDAQCMGRLLSGLALSGAWGCFDEFNRLSADTLAGLAHQLSALLAALVQAPADNPTAMLNGKQVRVSPWCGVAATLNPLGRGYGGRRALPAALAPQLRPLALRPPARRPLAARLLAARRLPRAAAVPLAAAIDDVFTLASTLLSDQRHYDWGLRALKAAVGSCGAALAGRPRESLAGQLAALRAVLRLNNVCKLTRGDTLRFEHILSMVFAGIPEEEPIIDPMQVALESSVKQLNLIHNKLQLQKCMEFYEQIQQRMGVAIVGPPGSGKSTIRKLLKTALGLQGKTIIEYVIYPKAMSRNWLLGRIDHDTRQWTDGVISSVAIEVSNQPPDVWSWVVCDGDIDPEWVEALNSVLDDNRLLTLPSGARVQLPRANNFVFETHSLNHASPATVSRMAIILLSEDTSCASEVLDIWMQNADFSDDFAKTAVPVLYQTIKRCLVWLKSHRSEVIIKNYDVSMVKQMLAQFEYVVQDMSSKTIYCTAEDIVNLAVERSVSGVIKDNVIDNFYQEVTEGVRSRWGEDAGGGTRCAGEGSAGLAGARLQARAPALRASRDHNVLLVGPDACAKGVLAEYILKEWNSTVITIECTPMLEPSDIVTEMKRNNLLRSGGPGTTGGVTLMVRGLHRARVDAWGSCPVHAFLLQVVCGRGAWEGGAGAAPQWRGTCVRVLATAAAPARLAPRLAACLSVLVLPEPEDDELLELSRNHLRENTTKIVSDKDIDDIARNIVSLYNEVTETFSSQPHYKWNSSHLQSMCENMKWYSPANVTELLVALNTEANMTFRERLVTDDERSQYNAISRNYIKHEKGKVFYEPKLRSDGVYLEAVEYQKWTQSTQKLINQCLTENERVFGESGAEVCAELAVLCPAIAMAMNGGTAVCVSETGVGRAAAAHVVCAALGASVYVVREHQMLHNVFKNALSAASEGARACVVVCAAGASAALALLEALTRAAGAHALPAALARIAPAQAQHTLQEIKENLGILICLDKYQEDLPELMETYPLLYNASRFVWLDRWCEDTLRKLPVLILQRLMRENAMEMCKEELNAIPVDGFVSIYNSLPSYYLRAPCRYINFIRCYFHIMTKKKEYLMQRKNVLSAGVEALQRARNEVAILKEEATQQELAFTEEQAKANAALDQIGATVRATTDKKEEMHRLKKNIEIENEKLQIRKKEIENELAAVEPIIAAARAAVGDIRPEALSEIRSLRAPPDVVRDVLEGVLRLMGIADTSWHSMKSFLSKRGVKEDIRRMDASSVSAEAAAAVSRLVEKRASSFEESAAKRASAACAPLAAWVRANLAHAHALASVRPLRERQRTLQRNLQEAEGELAGVSSGLATVEERVGVLKQQLGAHTREAAALELRLAAATRTLAAAAGLLQRLQHEDTAWVDDLKSISKEILELSQRSLLAAGYLVYLPELTEPQAKTVISEWCEMIGYEETSFSSINFLSTPEKQLKWETDGLPSDQSAIKNAVVIDQFLRSDKCGLTPLIIDPEGEAEAWLKKTLGDTPCDFVSQHSDKLLTVLQYAARLGRVAVVTEVEELAQVASWCGARVLLVARASPPHLQTHRKALLSPLYFTARLHALIDQLVHYTIQKQNPKMNERYKEIKLHKAMLQKQQHELQEDLLKDLSNNRDILHDENLLASLKKTRNTSDTITEALDAARAIEQEMQSACAAYEPSALRAAHLVLAVKQLTIQKPLVTLPIEAVQDVFVDAVNRATDPKNINSDEIVKQMTRTIIDRVLLSLHKKDKHIVIMHLMRQVYDDIIPDKLWKIFVGHISLVAYKNTMDEIKKQYKWVSDDESLKKLAQVKMQDEGLFNRLSLDNSELWLEFLKSGNLHTVRRLKLNSFEAVVAVAAIRPQSVYRTIVSFVDEILGGGSRQAPLARAADWSRATRPALLLGAHAAHELAAHAHLHSRALVTVGIEEGRSAWESSLERSRGGGWLAVVVGASAFTRDLQAFIASLAHRPAEELHEEFRLWITTEDREIPSNIANNCVNVVLEAPAGVKHNVCGTLSAWAGVRTEPALARFLAALALCHAVLQERRAYIPQGWSQWYAWEWGELSAGRRIAERAGAGRAARELCGALYGARIACAADARVLHALLARHLARFYRPAPASADGAGAPVMLPLAPDLHTYLEVFDSMPDIDSPELLGLPANCREAWEQNAADTIITGLRELDTTTVSKKNENTVSIKTILTMWKKMMSGNPLLKQDYVIESDARGGWWRGACASEARDAAGAARALHAALAAAARAPAHARAAPHKVPDEWQLLWSGPDSPDDYIREFCFRANAAVGRLNDCSQDEDYIPKEVDLRSFLRPARAACALRGLAAARLRCPADSLALTAAWDHADGSGDGLVVRGLRLSGAEWDGAGGVLRPARAGAAPHAPAPPLLLRYVRAEEQSSDGGAFEVRVFASAAREAELLRVRAPLAAGWPRERAQLNAVALFVAPAH